MDSSAKLYMLGLLLLAVCYSSEAQKKGKSDMPYSNCPDYVVNKKQPINMVTMQDSLTFLVKPTHPAVILNISVSEDQYYQAQINGTMIELQSCDLYYQCQVINEGGHKATDLIVANKWNAVTVALDGDNITVSANQKQNVMGNIMSMPSKGSHEEEDEQRSVKISFIPDDDPDYSIETNVYCNDTYKPDVKVMTSAPIVDTDEPTTLASIDEFTPSTTAEQTSSNKQALLIVIGVLSVIIALFLIGILWYCFRKGCKPKGSPSSYQLQEDNLAQQTE